MFTPLDSTNAWSPGNACMFSFSYNASLNEHLKGLFTRKKRRDEKNVNTERRAAVERAEEAVRECALLPFSSFRHASSENLDPIPVSEQQELTTKTLRTRRYARGFLFGKA